LNPLKEISPDKIVYIPFYVPLENKWYLMDERSLKYKFFDMLKVVNPSLKESSIIGFRVSKSPYAQAICTVRFKNKVPQVSTQIKNLFLLDSTQLYPSDRTLSAMIGLAEKMLEDNF